MAESDWNAISDSLNIYGAATIESLLRSDECEHLVALYANENAFRKKIVMARHGYGRGEYKYFAYPLPPLIESLRTALYARLAPIANAWNQTLDNPTRYPATHADFLHLCHEAGQTRPTPLLLQYGPGDYNCLHQDLYGDLFFPLQVAILL